MAERKAVQYTLLDCSNGAKYGAQLVVYEDGGVEIHGAGEVIRLKRPRPTQDELREWETPKWRHDPHRFLSWFDEFRLGAPVPMLCPEESDGKR